MSDQHDTSNGDIRLADQTPTFDGPTSMVEALRAEHGAAQAAVDQAQSAGTKARRELAGLEQGRSALVAQEREEDARHKTAKMALRHQKDEIDKRIERAKARRDQADEAEQVARHQVMRSAGALRAYEQDTPPRMRAS